MNCGPVSPPRRTRWSHLAWEGAAERYPDGIPDNVRNLDHELALIAKLDYAPYFLTVHHIVRYARSRNILCQGRGSAANSAVCYCLRITDVDPREGRPPVRALHFLRSRRAARHRCRFRARAARGGDPAHLPALRPRPNRHCGTVISYRGRSAVREIGKMFGLSEDTIGALSSSIWGMGGGAVRTAELSRAGIDVTSARMKKMRALVEEIQSFPRHLSQHVGGFVITRSRLDEVVPIGNAAMKDRTFVEWDKDDLDALGILKVDVLGLGMLTCIRKALELVEKHYGSFRSPRTRKKLASSRSRPFRRRKRPSIACCSAPIRSAFSRWRAGRRCRCCRGSSRAVLRPRDRGRDRTAGTDPGRHGASLSAPATGNREGRVSIQGA